MDQPAESIQPHDAFALPVHASKVLTPNDFTDLAEVERRLLCLEDCYQQTAVWFGWRLTGAGLDLLVTGSAAWSQGARWLPGQLLGALATGGTADVTYARAAALLAVYLAIALAAAATLLARRDVTS